MYNMVSVRFTQSYLTGGHKLVTEYIISQWCLLFSTVEVRKKHVKSMCEQSGPSGTRLSPITVA